MNKSEYTFNKDVPTNGNKQTWFVKLVLNDYADPKELQFALHVLEKRPCCVCWYYVKPLKPQMNSIPEYS
jgi:hypothetical protein